jgi:tetratricopeptide (TPR) repeat protein
MNMVALWQVGTVLEPHYGRGRFVGLYLAAGLAGSAVSLAWSWRDPVSSAGASGAISGLIAAGAVAGHYIGTTQARLFSRQMLVWAGIVMVYGAITQADNAAHAGGLVAGAAVAWALDGGGRAARRQGARSGVGLGGVLLVAVVGGAFALAARHQERAFSVERLINDGVELARAGKDRDAIAKYREALELDWRRPIGHYDLALALLHVEDFPGAEKHAREAVTLDARHKDSWWVLSEALTRLGRAADARQAFDRYLALGGTRAASPADGAGANANADAGER